MEFLQLPISHRDTWATLIAFLLPLIFSILAWAKETLSPMACSWLRLSSTRWEILHGKNDRGWGLFPKSLQPPAHLHLTANPQTKGLGKGS